MLYGLLLLSLAAALFRVWHLTKELQHSRRAVARLRVDRERYRALTEVVPVGIFRSNASGQCSHVNEYWCQITGQTLATASEAGWQQTLHPDNCSAVSAEWAKSVQTNQAAQLDYRIQQPDGTVVWVYGQTVAERDVSGQVISYVSTLTTIDSRKWAEQALQQSEAKSQAILAAIPDYLVRIGVDGMYRELVMPEREFALVSPHGLAGRAMTEVLSKEVADRQQYYLERALQTGELQVYEQTVQIGDRTQEEEVRVIQSGVDEALFIIRDISDRKRAEKVLQQTLRQERTLNRIVQAIRNSLDLTTVFATAAAETAQLLPGLNCSVVQYLAQADLWKIVAKSGRSADASTWLGFEISDTSNPLAAQLKQRQIVKVEDTDHLSDPVNRPIAERIPGAWLMMPLVINGQVWGSFTLSISTQGYCWEDKLVDLAQAVACQLEVALQQALLYQQVEREKQKLLASQTALSQAQQVAQMGSWEIDLTTKLMTWSDNLFHLFGLNPADGEPNLADLIDSVHPEDRSRLKAMFTQVLTEGIPYDTDLRISKADGSLRYIESRAEASRDGEGQIIKVFGTSLDISDRKQAEATIQKNEQRFRNIAANLTGVILQYILYADGSDAVTYVSSGCYDLWELTPEESVVNSQVLWDLIHEEDRPAMQASILASAQSLEPWIWQYRIVTPSSRVKWLEATGRPERHDNGDVVWDTLILDVSDRVQAEEQLKHDALHDALTGLPNRMLLLERLTLALARANRHADYRFAVLFLDLDNFKVINDSLGHLAGDELLIRVATVLTETIRETDLAARLGGDEFVILLDGLDRVEEAETIAERILSALQGPLWIGTQDVFVSTSIGVVVGTESYQGAEDLLRDSDLAMYQAKRSGRGQYAVFESALYQRAVQRLQMENDLRKALDNGEFVLHYQPIICLHTREIQGFEALLRWQHPRGRLLLPVEFVEVAEETGQIKSIGTWVLHSACEQLSLWQSQFPNRSLRINVNLSVVQLQGSLLQQLDMIRPRVQPNTLVLEVTESMLIQNLEMTAELLKQIKAREVCVSIDDFGTGYSSLSYLHQLPFDSLKIDRTFISPAGIDNRSQIIAESIITLSNLLKLNVIAEGIETAQQLAWLRGLGCELGQGRFFSPPLPARQATRLIQSFQ